MEIQIEKTCEQVSDILHRVDVMQRYRGITLVLGRIYGEVGTIIDSCQPNVKNFPIDMERYMADVLYYNRGMKLFYEDNSIGGCIWAVERWNDTFDTYIQDTKEQRQERVELYKRYWVREDITARSKFYEYSCYGAFSFFYRHEHTSEFIICRRVYNMCDGKSTPSCFCPWEFDYVAKLVFLYMALMAELATILDEMYIEGIQPPESATITPDVKTAIQRATTPESKKNATQTKLGAKERDLEIAQPYIDEAISEGMIVRNGTGGYTWKLGNVGLAYFIKRIFEPKQPPYKTFEHLFGVAHLSQSWNHHTDSYKYNNHEQNQAQKDIDKLVGRIQYTQGNQQ